MLFTRNNGHSENLVDAIYPENGFFFQFFVIFTLPFWCFV